MYAGAGFWEFAVMAKAPKEEAKSQRQRFIEAARQAEADESEEAFEQRLKTVAGGNSANKSKKRESHAHASDCATHNGPAMPAGPCDCDADDDQSS